MKKYKVSNKKRFYIFIASVTFAFLASIFIWGGESVQSQAVIKYDNVIVQNGDTLWSIAERYNKDTNKDIRQYVYEIKKENNIFGDRVTPNQTLMIPRTF